VRHNVCQRELMNSMSRRIFVAALPLMAVGLASAAHAQDNPPAIASATLFQNVRIFDGKGASLSAPSNVLIKGNIIERISPEPIAAEPGVTTIAGNGRTLMPGLIDAHWHAMLIRPNPAQAIVGDVGYNNIAASVEATDTLMRGFTTVRDVGGPVFGLKAAIDAGLLAGPRIYPSGAMITVTSGHGDFRQLSELPRTIGGMLSRMEQIGGSMVADSPDEVRVRVREQLMQGASQIRPAAVFPRRSVRSTCRLLRNRKCGPPWSSACNSLGLLFAARTACGGSATAPGIDSASVDSYPVRYVSLLY
jgi:hypothetical protein